MGEGVVGGLNWSRPVSRMEQVCGPAGDTWQARFFRADGWQG
jgi:hypothetical protein